MKTLAYILVLMAVLVAVPVLSNIVGAQSVPFDRNLCQQNCGSLMAGAGSSGGYSNYYACMQKCDTQFWNDVDRENGKTERSR